MAELDALTSPPHQKLAPKLQAGSSSPPSPLQQHPYKPITGLISKAAFFLLLVALLPLFPSQAPEFVNQTLLTRSWELLHLLLVGIAVSYGLFSHRNADPAAEKEALYSTADTTPQSYLTQLLQVSPVFDDEEPETPAGHDENNGLQMWTSRYHRGEPTVVVAPESPGYGDSVGRRLLLPVRSLRSPVPHTDSPGKKDADEGPWIAAAGSCSFPRGRTEDRKVREVSSLDLPPEREELAGDRAVVLPSAIPWRSSSGRMELRDETSSASAPSSPFSPIPSPETDAVTYRSLSFRSPPSRPSSATLSPSLSPEPRAKADEDPWKRKKPLLKSPPPPPPPPPHHFVHQTLNPPPEENVGSRSFREEPKNSSGRSRGWDDDRGWSSDLGSPRSSRLIKSRPRSHAEGYHPMGRSVRTVRPWQVLQDAMADATTPVTATRKKDKKKKKNKKEQLEEEVAVASDGRDSDEASGASDASELPPAAAAVGGAQEEEENEVDKKADEFIAKFKEQIRLQRIDSIKKTAAGQHRVPRKPGREPLISSPV